MNRRQQLRPFVGQILDIFGCDIGPAIIAHLLTVAALLDEQDDLIGDRLTIEADDDSWHPSDIG